MKWAGYWCQNRLAEQSILAYSIKNSSDPKSPYYKDFFDVQKPDVMAKALFQIVR